MWALRRVWSDWISGLSWHPEFVHCNVALRCHDAKETCFFPAWFCGRIAWVIVRLHNTCRNSPLIPKDGERDIFCWLNSFEFLYTRRAWMTIFHWLPFVFWVIMMNPGFVSIGNILEEIIPFETILVKTFWSNSFPVFLHGVSQLSWDPPGTNFSVV